MTFYSHDTATIDEGALIGKGSKIWHYSHVCNGSIIGDYCTLGQNVFIGGNSRIGKRCKIQNNVSIYDGVVLEDNVFCGPSVVFTNVINPRAAIEKKDEYRTTTIKKGATLGANSTIVCGVTIGEYAIIGAGSVVTKDVKAYSKVYGVPAKHEGWVTEEGENLQFMKENDCYSTCPKTSNTYYLNNEQVLKVGNR